MRQQQDERLAQLEAGLGRLGFESTASEAQLTLLLKYCDELARWNRVYNLTRVEEADWISHHLLDSIAVYPWMDSFLTPGSRVIDIGSGGGLPGIPLAILFADTEFTLLDSNGKKARFLEQVRINLDLSNVLVEQARAEALKEKFEIVTCRAFASLGEIVRLAAHLVAQNGRLFAMKGVLSQDELDEPLAPLAIDQVIPLSVPFVEGERHLVIMKHAT